MILTSPPLYCFKLSNNCTLLLMAVSGLRRSCPSMAINPSRSFRYFPFGRQGFFGFYFVPNIIKSEPRLNPQSNRTSRGSRGLSNTAGFGSMAHSVPKKPPSFKMIGTNAMRNLVSHTWREYDVLHNAGSCATLLITTGWRCCRISWQIVVSSFNSPPGCSPNSILSLTLQAIHFSSRNSCHTGQIPYPGRSGIITSSMDGTMAILEIFSIICF